MEKKQAIEERFAILHNEVYCQMTNAEKNEFDPEVELPVLKEMFIDLKKTTIYQIGKTLLRTGGEEKNAAAC